MAPTATVDASRIALESRCSAAWSLVAGSTAARASDEVTLDLEMARCVSLFIRMLVYDGLGAEARTVALMALRPNRTAVNFMVESVVRPILTEYDLEDVD